jgi:CheY-like chemotaxis protein
LELAMEIQADARLAGLPMVMLSSAGRQFDIGTAAAAGFAAFLNKPVTALQLSRCITRVMQEAGPSHGARRADPEIGTAELGPGRSLRLLVVEDNPANQRVASMLLGKMGYAVQIAGNGQLGLVALAAGEFDAVVMDCQMPVMDGYEATRRIRAGAVAGIDPKLPVIAVTAYARTEDRARCLEAGMNDVIVKPVRKADLERALDRWHPLLAEVVTP